RSDSAADRGERRVQAAARANPGGGQASRRGRSGGVQRGAQASGGDGGDPTVTSWAATTDYLPANITRFDASDPSARFVATTTTRSPTASGFDTSLISVTGVFGGTVTFVDPPG